MAESFCDLNCESIFKRELFENRYLALESKIDEIVEKELKI